MPRDDLIDEARRVPHASGGSARAVGAGASTNPAGPDAARLLPVERCVRAGIEAEDGSPAEARRRPDSLKAGGRSRDASKSFRKAGGWQDRPG